MASCSPLWPRCCKDPARWEPLKSPGCLRKLHDLPPVDDGIARGCLRNFITLLSFAQDFLASLRLCSPLDGPPIFCSLYTQLPMLRRDHRIAQPCYSAVWLFWLRTRSHRPMVPWEFPSGACTTAIKKARKTHARQCVAPRSKWAGTQALYDWHRVNRLDANGRHQDMKAK